MDNEDVDRRVADKVFREEIRSRLTHLASEVDELREVGARNDGRLSEIERRVADDRTQVMKAVSRVEGALFDEHGNNRLSRIETRLTAFDGGWSLAKVMALIVTGIGALVGSVLGAISFFRNS